MKSWQRLSEQQIRKAEAEGQLSGLSGEGQPLPERPGDAFVDPGEAVGHRIMAEAGALPEEITLKRALEAARAEMTAEAARAEMTAEAARAEMTTEAARAAWSAASDPAEKKRRMAEIADLELRHAIAREARLKFLGRPGG